MKLIQRKEDAFTHMWRVLGRWLLRKLRMIQVMQNIRLHMMLDWLADLLSLNGPEYNISLRHKRGGGGSRAALQVY